MSFPDVFSPTPLNVPNVPYNLPDEQPHRMENPLARNVHQVPKTGEPDEEIRG